MATLPWLLGTLWGHEDTRQARWPISHRGHCLSSRYCPFPIGIGGFERRKVSRVTSTNIPSRVCPRAPPSRPSCSPSPSSAAPGPRVQHLRSSCCYLAGSASSNLSARRRGRAMPARLPLQMCTINCQPSSRCLLFRGRTKQPLSTQAIQAA